MANNIEQAAELVKLFEQQAKILAEQETSLKNQLAVTQQLVAALRAMPMEELSDASAQLTRSVQETAKSMEGYENGQQSLENIRKALEEVVKENDKLGSSVTGLGKQFLKLAPVAATVEGIVGGFNLLRGAMSSVVSVGSSVISGLLQLGAAIISAPFKLLNGLMSMAAQGGGSELRQAMEELRKEFGDLAHNESRAVLDAWRGIDHFGGRLAETGLSIWRTMGNMAESLRALTAIAKNMGVVFSNLQDQFAGNAERIFAYVKGLHLSEEAQKALAETAYAFGREITDIGREITQMAFGMGDAFGINGALISRDIGEMMTDFHSFGNLAIGELSEIAVYARRLGVEVKALLGVVDQFDNFENAATSVAQLSQAFGLQLDTLDLLSAQNPADRIEQLRKAFFSAGRSVENMTRQERALLAQQTGLDENTLKLVFSQENASKSYEDIQKQSEATQKQQISQAEAMQKLAGSIERLVKSGGMLQGGFFDIFIQGFLKGIRWTREFRHLMVNLRAVMRTVYFAGIQVGRAFVDAFPGVRQFLTGIADIFDRRRWQDMTQGIVRIFRRFFSAIAGNDPHAVKNFLKQMQDNFFNWFNTRTAAGRGVIEGFQKFTKAFVNIAGQFLAESMRALGQAFRGLADFIRDPSSALKTASAGGEGVIGFIIETLRPAIDAIVAAWPDLRDGFIELMEVAWQKLQPILQEFLVKRLHQVVLFAFGPSLIGGTVRGVSVGLASLFTKGILGAFTGGGARQAAGALSKGLSSLTGAMNNIPAANPAGITGVAAGVQQGGVAANAAKGFSVRDAAQLGAKLVILAGALAIGGVEFAIALAAMKGILAIGGINRVADAVLPLLVLGAAVTSTIILALATKALNPGNAGQLLANLVAGATALAVGGVLFAGSLALISGVLEAAGLTSFEAIGWPLAVLAVAILATIALALTALTLEPSTLSTAAAMMAYGALLLAVSGVAFAAALWAVKQSLQTAGMDTLEKAGEPLVILGGAILAMIGLAGAVMLMAAVNPLIVAAGLLNGIILLEVAKAAVGKLIELKDAMSGISAADIPRIVEAVEAMSLIYGATAAFALASAAFGVILLSIGGGLGLIVGLAALAEISTAGVKHARDIIEQIKSMPDVPESKIDAFVKIVEALGGFAANVAQIINASTPSFLSLAAMPWGRNPEAEAKASLGMVGEIVSAIGDQTRQVIQTVVNATKGMSQRDLDAAESLAPLLSATVELAKALSVNSELTEGLFGDLLSVRIIQTAGDYFEQVGNSLTTLLPGLHGVLQQIGNAPTIDQTKVETFATFLEALGPLIQALSPSGGMAAILGLAEGATELENMSRTVLTSLGFETGGPVDRTAQMLRVVSRFAQTMLSVISEGGFLRSIQDFIGQMVTIGTGINPGQIESVKTVAEIFESVTGLVSSFAEQFSSEDFLKAITSGSGRNSGRVARAFSGIIRGIITPISTQMPILIENLKNLTEGLSKSQIENMASVVGVFSTIIETVGRLAEVVGTIGDTGESGFSAAAVRARLGSMGEVLSVLFSEGGNSIITAIQALGRVSLPRSTKANAETVTKALEAVGNISEILSSGALARLQNGTVGSRGIDAIHSAMRHLFDPTYKGAGVQHYLTTLENFASVRLPRVISTNAETLKTAFNAIGEIDFEAVQGAIAHIDDNFSERLQTGIAALIESINETGNALKGLGRSPINLQTELQRVNNALNLRGSSRLEIRQQPVTLNINFTVTMDSKELESALVGRPNSRIRVGDAT